MPLELPDLTGSTVFLPAGTTLQPGKMAMHVVSWSEPGGSQSRMGDAEYQAQLAQLGLDSGIFYSESTKLGLLIRPTKPVAVGAVMLTASGSGGIGAVTLDLPLPESAMSRLLTYSSSGASVADAVGDIAAGGVDAIKGVGEGVKAAGEATGALARNIVWIVVALAVLAAIVAGIWIWRKS